MALEFSITKTWDSQPLSTQPVHISLEANKTNAELVVSLEAPWYNDPQAPTSPCGSLNKLWDYEVVELFFMNDQQQYLEVELSPSGHWLVLQLEGPRNILQSGHSLDFDAIAGEQTWSGTARIPGNYFPPRVSKFNAYAIHGSGPDRIYQALYPVPKGQFSEPDFHRLEFFQDIDMTDMLPMIKRIKWPDPI